jgi:predicted ATPase/DNA-binding CsgD family transcriptional regulator
VRRIGQAMQTEKQPHVRRLPSRFHNLPAPMTSLIGRQRELADARPLLGDRQVRLITLTGAPGAGKTRLALSFGEVGAEFFPDGVWFVPLAGLERSELVLPTIAQVLGVRQIGRRPLLETLRQALWGHRLMLVLDNFEHLLPAAPEVVELLASCRDITVLVTSRGPLRVSGEHQFPVAPLEVPRLDDVTSLDNLARTPAVRLFVERARAVRPDFALTEENASAIAALCVRLDGLPLAIELAAARCGLLEPSDLLARIGSRLSLADGPRDLPPRQRTLRSAIGWSYGLLSPDEQRTFRRLSVFAGGWTFEAAQAVVHAPDEPVVDEVDAIAALIDRGLLQRQSQPGCGVRLSMLETVREYALEQLRASGELDEVRQRHAEYCLRLGEQVANPRLDGPDAPILIARTELEHDNLRAALRWFRDAHQTESFAQLAGALWAFWSLQGYWDEGLSWLEAALDQPQSIAGPGWARVLLGAAVLHRGRSDYGAAISLAQKSAAVQRQLGDEVELARTLTFLADAVALGGDPESAARIVDESVALRRQLGDTLALAWALYVAGSIAAFRGDFATAVHHYESALTLRRGQDDNQLDGQLLYGLGTMLAGAGDVAAARPLLDRALALFRVRGERRCIARVLLSTGVLRIRQGDVTGGRAMLEESLALLRRVGERVDVAVCLLVLGVPLAEGMWSELGQPAVSMWWRLSTGLEAPATTDFQAWRLTDEPPVNGALEQTGAPDALTPREVQIMKLLARRFTNREIASELDLSVRTVERHITNIFTKTALTHRHQALEYSQDYGLLPRD